MHLRFALTCVLLLFLSVSGRVSGNKATTSHKLDRLRAGSTGYCGNSRFDSTRSRDGFTSYGLDDTWQRFSKYLAPQSSNETASRIETLRRKPVFVRIGLVFDKSLADEFDGKESMVEYARNMIYDTQLFFEQPIMSDRVKIIFVIGSIKIGTTDYPPDIEVSKLLSGFGLSADYDKSLDLNILLTFRTLWDNRNLASDFNTKTIGMAHVGTFCMRLVAYPKVLVVSATSLGSSVVLAHELAHAFNVYHDGTKGFPLEEPCGANYIMGPSTGPSKRQWSKCSVDAVVEFFTSPTVFECIYDPKREVRYFENRKELDFTHGSEARSPLPGEKINIDMQCQLALDLPTTSSIKATGYNGPRYTFGYLSTCSDLICNVGRVQLAIGPALSGSFCFDEESRPGTCRDARCIR